MIGLIETEIKRDLTQRAAVGEGQAESAAVSDFEDDSEEIEESKEINEEQDESEAPVMSMSM